MNKKQLREIENHLEGILDSIDGSGTAAADNRLSQTAP